MSTEPLFQADHLSVGLPSCYLFEYDDKKDPDGIQRDFLKVVLKSLVAARMSEFSTKGAVRSVSVEIDVNTTLYPAEFFLAFHAFIKQHRQFLTTIVKKTQIDETLSERIELPRSQFIAIKFPPQQQAVRTLVFQTDTAIFKLDKDEQ